MKFVRKIQPCGHGTCFGVKAQHRTAFTRLWLSVFLVFVAQGLTLPLLSVRVVAQGVSLHQYGILQSAAAFATIMTQVQLGRLSHHRDLRRSVVALCLLAMALVLIIFPRAETVVAFGVLIVLHQVAFHAQRTLMTTWVSGWAETDNMGRMHGAFRVAGSLGWIVSTLFLGVLLDRFAFGFTFRLAAAIFMATAFFVVCTMKEPRPQISVPPSFSSQLSPGEQDDPILITTETNGFTWPRQLRPLLGALAVFALAQSMGTNFDFLFFAQDLGVSNRQFGWLSSLQAWLEVPVMLSMGIISDRFSVARLLGLGMAIGGLRWLLLAQTTGAVWAYGVQLMHAVGITVTDVLMVTVIARLVSSEHLGTALAWRTAVTSLAMLVAPTLGGIIAQHYTLRFVFCLSAVLALLASLIVWQVFRKSGGKLWGTLSDLP